MTAPKKKRAHRRVKASLPCTIKDRAGKEWPFELVDLSEAGVRIRCGHEIAANTEIRVAIVLPAARIGTKQDARLDTNGLVVWSHPVDDVYDTGIFFPAPDEKTRAALQAYVASAAQIG